MKAIISDIHNNIEAFKAVVEDLSSRNITEVICLGDIVGYGPDPLECLELARKHCTVAIKGNHEEAVLSGPVNFNRRATAAIEWTRSRIENSPPAESQKNLDFLRQLPDIITEDGITFVHGTPRRPTSDYLFPRDIRNQEKLAEIFAKTGQYCFVGHSHIPGVFTENGTYMHPTEMTMAGIYILDEEKAIINVGSVGQPRDGDNRACYCTFDGDSVVFRRVAYDYKATIKRIHANDDLDKSLGDRLAEGR